MISLNPRTIRICFVFFLRVLPRCLANFSVGHSTPLPKKSITASRGKTNILKKILYEIYSSRYVNVVGPEKVYNYFRVGYLNPPKKSPLEKIPHQKKNFNEINFNCRVYHPPPPPHPQLKCFLRL